MVSRNNSFLVFKVNKIVFKWIADPSAISELFYTLSNSHTSQLIFQSPPFDLAQISVLNPAQLDADLFDSLTFSFYMQVLNEKKLFGSTLIDLSQNLPLKAWLNILSNNDEILCVEIEIIKEENIENSFEIIQDSLDESEANDKKYNLKKNNAENKNEQEMNELLSLYEIDDVNKLTEKIEDVKDDIAFYHRKKLIEDEEAANNRLRGLERLQQLHKEIKTAKEENEENRHNASTFEEENLECELKQGLSKYHIENPEKLEEMIYDTKENISFCLKRKRLEEAKNEENILADLENLNSIYKRIVLKSMIIFDSEEILSGEIEFINEENIKTLHKFLSESEVLSENEKCENQPSIREKHTKEQGESEENKNEKCENQESINEKNEKCENQHTISEENKNISEESEKCENQHTISEENKKCESQESTSEENKSEKSKNQLILDEKCENQERKSEENKNKKCESQQILSEENEKCENQHRISEENKDEGCENQQSVSKEYEKRENQESINENNEKCESQESINENNEKCENQQIASEEIEKFEDHESLSEENKHEKCENQQIVTEENKIEEEINKMLRLYEIEDIDSVAEKIEEVKEDIAFYNRKKKYDLEEEEKKKLQDLERLLKLHEEINQNVDEELKQGLIKYEIGNPQQIEEKIIETKENISFYLRKKKLDNAKIEENNLADLEKLLSIYKKLSSKSMIAIDAKEGDKNKKIEIIEAMIDDISTMPFCIEKFLTNILCFAYYECYDFDPSLDIHAKFANIDPNIEFNYFIDYVHKGPKGILPSKLISHLKKHLKNEKWDKSIQDIQKILKEHIRPINIREVIRLINKSVRCSENLEKKDIILLIGFTGTGKSTTTHFLCGSEMKRVLEDNVTHIKFEAIKNPLLKNVTISSRAESETRYISIIPININSPQDAAFICDTPGLMDTNGAEVDIANTIGIVECVRKCKSVRPLILISSKAEGDRFEGIKKLAHTLARLVPNFDKYSRSFTYAFTKYSPEDVKNIHGTVKNAIKLIKNNSDKAFLKILKDIRDKTKNGVITIDPLKDNPQELLKKIMENEPIRNTRDAFESFITEDSSRSIKNQISVYSKGIVVAIDSFNYGIIKYNLDGLQYIANLFEQFRPQYDESVNYVIKKTKDIYENALEKLNKILDNHGILEKDDVFSYQEAYHALKASEEIRESHLRDETVKSVAMLNNLIFKLNLNHASIEPEISDLNFQLKNTKILSETFEEIAARYKDFSQEYINLIEEALISADSYLERNNYGKFAETVRKVKKCFEAAHDIINLEDLSIKYKSLLSQLISSLKSKYDSSITLLDKGHIEESDIKGLQQNISLIKSAIEDQNLRDFLLENKIDDLVPSIINEYKTYFESFASSLTDKKGEHSIDEIQAKFYEYNLLKEIPDINANIAPSYQNILDFSIQNIKNLKNEAKKYIKSFVESHESIKINLLYNSLASLESWRWLEEFKKGILCNVLSDLEKKLTKSIVGNLVSKLLSIDLGINSPSNVQKGYSIAEKSNLILQLQKYIPSVTEYPKIVWDKFWERIEETLRLIKNEFNPELDIDHQLNEIEKLKIVKKDYDKYIKEESAEKIEELLTTNGFKTIDEIDQEISKIQQTIEIFKEKKDKIPDIDNLENSYKYIEECKQIQPLPDSIADIVNSNIFSKLIMAYGPFLECLNNRFGFISDFIKNRRAFDMNALRAYTCQILASFQEISSLKTKSPTFYNFLDLEHPFAQFLTELNSLYSDVDEKLMNLNQNTQAESITLLLFIADELAKIDKTYSDLSKKYKQLQDSRLMELIELIEKYDFYSLKQTINKLGEPIPSVKDTISDKLYKAINDLLEDMKDRTKELNVCDLKYGQIDIIIENFKKVKCAYANNFYLYFDTETRKRFEKEEISIKKDLETKISNYLFLISDDIKINKFYEAEIKMKNIQYPTSDDLNWLFVNRFANKILEIEDNLNKFPQNIIDHIQKNEIKELGVYPLNSTLQIIEKASKDFPKYEGKSNEIRSLINEKIYDIKINFKKESTAKKKEKIHNISSVLNVLPEDIKISAKSLIKEIEASLKADKTSFRERIDSYVEGQSIKELCEFYSQSTRYSKSYLKYAKDKLKNMISSINIEINDALRKRNWELAFKKAHVLELKNEIEKILEDSDSIFKEILWNLNGKVNQNLKTLLNIEYKDSSTELVESFKFYKNLMDFKTNFKSEPKAKEIFPIENEIESIHAAILYFYQGLNKRYTVFKPPNSSLKCNQTLNKIKDWDGFLKIFKEFLSQNRTYTRFDSKIKEQWRYSEFRIDLTQALVELSNFFIEFKVHYEDIMQQALLDSYAKNIQEKWNQIRSFSYLKNHLNLETSLEIMQSKAIGSISNEINKIVRNALLLIDKQDIRNEEFNQIRSYYNFLGFFEKNLKISDLDLKATLQAIEGKIYDKIKELKTKAMNGKQLEEIIEPLLKMKELSINFPKFKEGLHKIIDDSLETIGKNSKGMILGIIGELGNHSTGLYILNEHKFFEGVRQRLWRQKTQAYGIDYTLEKLKGSQLNINELREKHQEYIDKFEGYSIKYQPIIHNEGIDNAISQIVAEIEITSRTHAIDIANSQGIDNAIRQTAAEAEIASRIHPENSSDIDLNSFKSLIPKLLAYISILWELCNIKKYNQDASTEEERELFALHPIQVLSIFRMIGIGNKENVGFQNNLVQILTGEGKSITLAFLSCMLALLGFTVNCACYSEHLSQRDFENFEPLYTALNVSSYIKYGTFNKLCEDEINSNGDIRERVLDLISPRPKCSSNITDNTMKRPKILLIDEVDVFFSKSFYGNIYRPLAKLKHPTIKILTDYIWKSREMLKNINIRTTNEYKDCCRQFRGFEFIIEEAVKDMKIHIQQFASHDYIVQYDKIGYKEHDGISFNKNYGYNTLFAYYFEHEKGSITQESLNENIFIGIKCGIFSFAEIPLKFKYIMGVTGTLETLGNYEKSIIENKYNIKIQTYMPSVFGDNRRTFAIEKDVHAEASEGYYLAIINEINEKIGKAGSKRAVLVFFEDEKKLMDFYNESALKYSGYDIQLITENLSSEDRGMMIKKATVPNTVTLLVRVFGRGIDFICQNQNMETNEGIHVLQTFFSENISEEIQIKGRSARQGQKGSYSIILLDSELEKFSVQKEDIKKMKDRSSIYNDLNNKRNEFNQIKSENQSTYIEEYKAQHYESSNFLNFIKNNDLEKVKLFLQTLNKGTNIESGICKTIVLMDATGSMDLLLQNAKNTVKIMFQRVCTILSENGINPECFQLQYCAYRNYSSHDKILQVSPWTNKSDILESFLENVKSEGGQGNEAIEVGLWHVNNAIKNETISQVILIGDRPPNTVKDIEEKRGKNSKYWNSTKFKDVSHYRKELLKIQELGVPINAFYVYSDAQKKFEKIAAITGGKSEFLHINSSSGAERLTDLVSTQVLGKVGGEDVVNAYWKKFPISYA
ncbi:unnamed protein product [Blepharisma stoltei]|uniref:SecA DEAD-like N-terminal domain-containing protein n=1 Tax=Blepharisma stoltei TaxID=1481888 RepID=A0AAU9IR75_9CILI|nr:unnamed protein product [Blepharisma stoltei]